MVVCFPSRTNIGNNLHSGNHTRNWHASEKTICALKSENHKSRPVTTRCLHACVRKNQRLFSAEIHADAVTGATTATLQGFQTVSWKFPASEPAPLVFSTWTSHKLRPHWEAVKTTSVIHKSNLRKAPARGACSPTGTRTCMVHVLIPDLGAPPQDATCRQTRVRQFAEMRTESWANQKITKRK